MALERMGHLHKALVTYERAFELDPEDPELLINLGLTAWNLKLTEGAAQDVPALYRRLPGFAARLQQSGQRAVRSGQARSRRSRRCAPRSTGCRDEAILWNSLATVLAEEGRADESLVFYEEALRLEPNFARAYHNLGYAYQHLGQLEDGAGQLRPGAGAGGRSQPSASRPRHSRSICLIGAGKLEEGFREYEIRNNQRFRAYFHHMIKAPRWKGETVERQETAAGRRTGPGR